MKCSFGCGRPAKFMIDADKFCCEKYSSLCPQNIRTFIYKLDLEKQAKKITIKLNKEESYRSIPNIAMTDDMVRVSVSLPIVEWKKWKRMVDVIE